MNEIKEKIKSFLPEYVQEITAKSKGNQYVCPFCKSGTGKNGTGAFTVYPERYYCFACQQGGDIFDLYADINHVDTATAMRELNAKYGFKEAVSVKKSPEKTEKDYTDFFNFAASNLCKTNYLTNRGISPEIQRKFRCGYVPEYRYEANKKTPAVIIPTSEKSSFMWRSTTENIKKKRGTVHIFNSQALENDYCFVVEGEIDCMSVVECGFSCIGLGSTSNIGKIFKHDVKNTVLIIAMDNDPPENPKGQEAAKKLEKLCTENKTAFITAPPDVWGGCKDANELLVKDRQRLTESLQALAERAENFNREEFFERIKKDSPAESWGQPESFENLKKPAAFPMQNLPPLLRDYLQAVSDYVQVVPEMAILPMLSVLALCVQGKAMVKHAGNNSTVPLNLYTITVAPPGERKSGCLREFMRPVEEFQAKYNKIHAPEIEEYLTERAFLENQRTYALKNGLQKAKAITKQLASLEKKHKLVLNISDTTPEALAVELYEQGEKMGIIDDEGCIFDVLSGIYSSGQVNINIFLKAYYGGSYAISRRTKENIELKSPLLTMGLMVQPEHLTEAMNNRQFVGRGLMYRFLFSFPESRAGYLKMYSPDVPEKLKKQYNDLINRLLLMPSPTDIPVIVCDREAELLFSDYHDRLQEEVRDGGMLEDMKQWALKQFERALRIAGILHLCEHQPEERLSGQTALNAIAIATWSENHALNALSGTVSEPPEIKNAKHILKKLKKCKKSIFSKSELLILCRPLHAPEINISLEILEDMDYIKREKIFRENGGNPKEVIKINPLIC